MGNSEPGKKNTVTMELAHRLWEPIGSADEAEDKGADQGMNATGDGGVSCA